MSLREWVSNCRSYQERHLQSIDYTHVAFSKELTENTVTTLIYARNDEHELR